MERRTRRSLLFGPLPIRVMIGTAFILHGYSKITDIAGTEGFLVQVGLPTALATPVALLEFIGGIVLILGILTRIAAGLFVIQMAAITLTIKLSKGFIGGFEIDLLFLAGAASLFITGPGRVSIEWNVIKREIFPYGKKLVASA